MFSKIDFHVTFMYILTISGETSVKWSPTRGAVIGYAQYLSAGAVLPLRYDETVLTRWGVEIMVGSPVFSVTATLASPGQLSGARKCFILRHTFYNNFFNDL